VAVQDLASRYRFEPLFARALFGGEIAGHLHQLFHRHGAPLFLKRDNGSNLNCSEVNDVLAAHGVIPLNSPAYYPRYNGAIENSIGQFKKHLLPCLVTPPSWDLDTLRPLGRALVVELNARRRPSLAGQTPAAVFHAGGPAWTKRFRQDTFQWIETRWRATVAHMEQPHRRQIATVWRTEAVAWLRCQALIRCSPNPHHVTPFPRTFVHMITSRAQLKRRIPVGLRFVGYCIAVAIMIACFGCFSTVKPQPRDSLSVNSNRFEYVGQIIKVQPLGTVESANRARWMIEAEIVSVSDTTGVGAPPIGSKATFFIHSVVKLFGEDRESVVGRRFRLAYESGFQNPYHGKVAVVGIVSDR
jgi:hypothetical protein